MKTAGTALAASIALAIAIALSGTSFHAVPTAEGWWRGLADLPGLAHLVTACAVAAGFAWIARRAPDVQRPALALALAGAPILPVLTGRFLSLLFFQGPVITMIAIASVVSAIAALRPRLAPLGAARESLLLFALAFAGYAALGTRLPGAAGPQGDEPHYLLMTESLLRDRDLDLANQFEERAYAPFYAGTLAAHTSPASPRGTRYAIHTPGLAALILPAYALGGYEAARLLMSAIAALATVLVHAVVREAVGSRGLALAAWAVLTFTPPLPFYAVALYPETPAALATAVFLWAAQGVPGPGRLAAVAAAAAALPWLHPKFLPLAGVGLLATLLRPARLSARLATFAPGILSTGLLLAYFAHVYGRAALSAAYGPGFASDVSLTRLPWGLAGLLADRQFGLWSVSPVWILVAPGFWLLLRQRADDALRALLLAGAVVGVGASFSMWWGGACPPGRFVVPALPALALALAPALAVRARGAAALAGLGFAVVLLAAQAPRAIHNRSDGQSALLRFLSPALDLDAVLPSFVVEAPATPGEEEGPLPRSDFRAPVLAAALTGGAAFGWVYGGRGLLAAALGYAVVAAGLRERPLIDRTLATQRLLAAWDADNLRGFRGPPDLATLAMPLELPRQPWTFEPGVVRSARRLDLVPGAYRLETTSRIAAEPGSRAVRLEVTADGLLLGQTYFREGEPPAPLELFLPLGARRLSVTATGVQGRAEVQELALWPASLVPRSLRERLTWPRQPEEGRYRVEVGGLRATILDRSEPEEGGFRVQGEAGSFLLEAPPGTTITMRLMRPHPTRDDGLLFGDRRSVLGSSAVVTQPAEAGIPLGGSYLIPVTLQSRDAWISFASSPAR